MRIAVLGFNGPAARELRIQAQRRGHIVADADPQAAVYFPHPSGSTPFEELARLAAANCPRLVLRSHTAAYGADPKNPGFITEDYTPRLAPGSPAAHWLEAEAIADRHPNFAIIRLCAVLDPEEGDPLVQSVARGWGAALAGRDPNVQFLSVHDAARVLLAAAESNANGIFNAAGDGVIPLKKAFRAAASQRLPRPELFLPESHPLQQIRFNWTVSSDRARDTLAFHPRSTTEAIAQFVREGLRRQPDLPAEPFDPWGLDIEYVRALEWWFTFLRRYYWRIDVEGLDNIPASGRAVIAPNHRGFMPLDAVMHLYTALQERGRIIRFLIIPSLLRLPFLSNFLTKLGGVIASQENAARLLAEENLVGIFPEGIRGIFSRYGEAYRLRDFAKSGFAKIAIENKAPVIPVAVVGHAEIFPILGGWKWTYITKTHGWPFFPIAPPFPLAPVPIPSKWHVRVLEPVSLDSLCPADAENRKLVRHFSRYIQSIIQTNIDDMLSKRRSWFWGRVLDGTAPARETFHHP